jgi:hypothetical protein
MASLLGYLSNIGVSHEFRHEPVSEAEGSPLEPVIYLHGQNLSCIRLNGAGSGGCSSTGDILRFQYEVHLDEELSLEKISDLTASTCLNREDGIEVPINGRIIGVSWEGHELARRLNKDESISRELITCAGFWNYLEYEIEAVSPGEIRIMGPRFTNPGVIAEVYAAGQTEEIQNCIFGYKMLDKIAGHIRAIAQMKHKRLSLIAPLTASLN